MSRDHCHYDGLETKEQCTLYVYIFYVYIFFSIIIIIILYIKVQ